MHTTTTTTAKFYEMHCWDRGQGGQLVAGDGEVTSSDQLGVTMLQIAWVVERKELCGQDLEF